MWFEDRPEVAVILIFLSAVLGILASGIAIGVTLMKLFG